MFKVKYLHFPSFFNDHVSCPCDKTALGASGFTDDYPS